MEIDFSLPIFRRSNGNLVVNNNSYSFNKTSNPVAWKEVQDWIAEGGIVQPEPQPPAPTPEQLKEREIAEKLAYLASTDWYVVRFAETSVAIPAEIGAARAEARARIDELRT